MNDSTELVKLESERLWDQAFEQLRNAIYAGRFGPGTVLSLRHLAKSFGTSITPVRDAVARLVSLGVLDRGARNAAIVPFVTTETFTHLTSVRYEIEGLAAREAALGARADSALELAAQLDHMKGLIAAEQFGSYLEAHRAFHFKIYAMAGNPILSEIIEMLWLRFGPVLSFVVPDYVKLLKGTDYHTAIVAAIRRGDGAAAENAIISDIREAAGYISGLADARGVIRPPALNEQAVRTTAPEEGLAAVH
ncbi:MAG: GntR family transcriptional regulator [Rhodospirillaceae bacterium]